MAIQALLLAAGAARRFGSDKLTADLGGEPLVVRAARNLLAAGLPVLCVVRDAAGPVAGLVQALPGAEVGHCPDAHLGMGLSLAWGVRATRSADGWLVALGDMPAVTPGTIRTLARIAGWLLAGYMVLKIADTLAWAWGIVPRSGLTFMDFYREGPYGVWLFVAEIVVCGMVPAILLLIPRARENRAILLLACLMNCTGIVLNRFVFIVVTLAIPVMPFDRFWSYLPTWQEWGVSMAMIGYGILLFSFSYRYLPLFPKERELNATA